MEINCSKCGAENWLENQSKCLQCGAVLRRCADCANYQRTRQWCASIDTEVEVREAEQPSTLAMSVNCSRFSYRGPSV